MLATFLVSACGLVVDYDFETTAGAASSSGSGAAGAQGGAGGASASGGAGPGGSGAAGGGPAVGWTLGIEGNATVTSLSVDDQSGDVYVAGIAEGALALGRLALVAPEAGFVSTFVARIAADGGPLALVEIAKRAAKNPADSFLPEPEITVRALGGSVWVATTSEPTGDVPLLGALGSEHHGDPYGVFGRLDAALQVPAWTVTCEAGTFLKNASLAVSGAMAAAVFGGAGVYRCDSSPSTLVDTVDEGLVLAQVEPIAGASIGLPTLIAGQWLQSAPSIATLGSQRAIVGHFADTITDGNVTFDWDGPEDLGAGGFGSFVKTYQPDSLHYVGRLSDGGAANGRLRIAGRGDRFVIAHTTAGALQGVRVLTLTPPAAPVEVAVIDGNNDEVGTAVAVDADATHAFVGGALGVAYVAGTGFDGTLDDSLVDHSAGCSGDDAESVGDAFWAVLSLDASYAFQAARAYGDCAHQRTIAGDFDADGNLVITGVYQGTLTTEHGSITAVDPEGGIWIHKAVRTW